MLKKDIPVIKLRWYAWALAVVLLLAGGISFAVLGGFNLGVDFESGLSQRIQIAPIGLEVTYAGNKDAVLAVSGSGLNLEVRGDEGVSSTSFSASEYPTAQDLATALGAVQNINVAVVDGSLETAQLLSGYGFPATLSAEPTKLNFQSSGNANIEDVRSALDSLGNVRVQTVGVDGSQTFQVRLGIKEGATQDSMETEVKNALNAAFGAGNVVVLQSDYIGPKFSATLLSSSILAIVVAMALILLYIWVRFRFAYAVSSLIALVHDILMMLTVITLFRFEFSGITVAALLTIIGYSLNNTIVIFDRIRENVALAPDASLSVNIDHSVTQSLSRTVMSAVTTLIAIIPLAIFASGDIQLFAVKMGFGILFGTYSSNLLAPAMLYWISNAQAKKKEKKAE
ncbi:MAG: protein translocase subunit SecF [Sphaerochaeta sp.]|uniref:protein translocase subunit SecF n=1 Tax=uncultured Sphaerochaeta sp. TaxID=886478 RepID=UPI002A0A8642|nr:protein translocase subunit SecF [uncultured Sphaerochaeta sp.]MCK9347685.1 protein translocase subunit SecF [Sphaerochaeta sp.]MDD4300956.1 protein translocase subunit SecF [Sphaerochaeta sp.]MDD4646729.1 protein translocase subunit SecF [Sphaerochaeta sp.]MDY0243238.1 protein translocase subunit SecF [Sphaerochaeta sp.]